MSPCRTLLVLALFPACQDGGREPIVARLRPLPSCEAAISHVREVALEAMNRRIDAALSSYLAGGGCYRGGYGEDASDGNPRPSPTTGPQQGTGTNNQVSGVDEADFVKNDGQYIYLAQNGVLRIIDAWPADQTHEVSKTPLAGIPRKLFVHGDRALVYVAIGDDTPRQECTYGYDCELTGDGTTTRALVFDITDRAAPRLEREIALPGSLIAGRRIGNTVHTVVTTNPDPFQGVRDYPEDADLCGYNSLVDQPPMSYRIAARRAFERLRADNRRIIEATDVTAILPVIVDSLHATDTAACTSMYASQVTDGAAFMTLASLDLTATAPVTSSTIVSRAGAVYASSDALYMAVPHASDDPGTNQQTSCIHKFAISEVPDATTYIGSGTVVGRPLNQFAMDEHEGYLRIATTDGRVPDPDVESRVTVLAEEGDALVTIGLVAGIAPTETSAYASTESRLRRHLPEDRPLFTFDLGDSAHHACSAAKIPGSRPTCTCATVTTCVVATTPRPRDFEYWDGVLLRSRRHDPATPTLAHRHVIGTRGSSSEALTNHLAFTWYREESLLAVPMTVCEGGDDGGYGDTMSFSGRMLFDVATATGIAEHGRVRHPVPTDITCGNWWTDADSAVKRSLFLERFVYSISDAHLKVQSIDALGTISCRSRSSEAAWGTVGRVADRAQQALRGALQVHRHRGAAASDARAIRAAAARLRRGPARSRQRGPAAAHRRRPAQPAADRSALEGPEDVPGAGRGHRGRRGARAVAPGGRAQGRPDPARRGARDRTAGPVAAHAARAVPQDSPRLLARARDPRGPQSPGPPDDRGGRPADVAPRAGPDRSLRARRAGARRVARGHRRRAGLPGCVVVASSVDRPSPAQIARYRAMAPAERLRQAAALYWSGDSERRTNVPCIPIGVTTRSTKRSGGPSCVPEPDLLRGRPSGLASRATPDRSGQDPETLSLGRGTRPQPLALSANVDFGMPSAAAAARIVPCCASACSIAPRIIA